MRRLVWVKAAVDINGDKCGSCCAFRQFGVLKGYVGACCQLFGGAKVQDRRAPACMRAEKAARRRP